MNFETFLFILKKNFNVTVSIKGSKATVTYIDEDLLFELSNNRVKTMTEGSWYVLDLNFQYCSELAIIDYFISVLKLNNVKFRGLE